VANERILIVDDEKLIRMSLVEELTRQGFRVFEAETGGAGLARANEGDIDLVLLDYRMPDMDGLTVLGELAQKHPDTLVILMTAYSSIDNAVQAIKRGAYDYLNKPFDMDEMVLRVRKALETTELRRESRLHLAKAMEQNGLARLVGKSPALEALRDQVRRIAHTGASTVLIRGESGVGKDVIAKAIHYESDRARLPFVNVTCTAIPESLLESELFGHERGAFTDARGMKKGLFELARGGTVFLDEIGDLPPVAQGNLLRVLQEGEVRRLGESTARRVDVRLVAATHRDLDAMVRDGRFRQDLYYRLKVCTVTLPPLRERGGDVMLLAEHFVAAESRRRERPQLHLAADARRALEAHRWPGNVRELAHSLQAASALAGDGPIRAAMLDLGAPSGEVRERATSAYHQELDDFRRGLLLRALRAAGGNRAEASRRLGLSRQALSYLVLHLGLDDEIGTVGTAGSFAGGRD